MVELRDPDAGQNFMERIFETLLRLWRGLVKRPQPAVVPVRVYRR